MTATTFALWPRRAQSGAPLLAFVSAAAALVVVGADRSTEPQSGELTSYVGLSSIAAAVDLAAGLALLVVAAVALWNVSTARSGLLALVAGIAWFAPDLEGWVRGGSLVHSLGALAVPLFPALLGLLVASAARSHLGARATVAVVGAAAVIGAAALLRAAVRDPLYDPYCWRNCLGNDFLVRASPALAVDLDRLWLGATVGLAAVVVAAAFARPRVPVLLAGAVAAAAQGAYAVALLQSPRESPHRLRFEWLFYGRALSVLVFAAGLLGGVVWTWRRRGSIVRLARVLADGPAPGQLRDALGKALGDPMLDVAYWLPRSGSYVDRDGKAFDPWAADGRAVTPIVRNGVAVAAVLHDPAVAADAFDRALGPAARLAVENERLQTEVRAQVEALRRSRKRIIERADAERRRLERDLHDGAQQRLLAVLYDLKLARSSANSVLAAQLDDAAEEAQLALEELRQLAHGIYPAILAEAGLQSALASLADDAPLAVEIAAFDQRYDEPVEAAVYVTVRESIEDAGVRAATWIRIAIEGRGETLELMVEDDGVPRAADFVHVQDRMGALGGTVDVGERTLTAVIPCG